jgi:hypothetical protein
MNYNSGFHLSESGKRTGHPPFSLLLVSFVSQVVRMELLTAKREGWVLSYDIESPMP